MSLLPDPNRMQPAAPQTGRLSLVGAGPGAADLMTLRAVDRLRQADIVLHDRLVGPGVLALIPPGIPRIDVGKECGSHRWTQAAIDARIRAELRRGRHVVRLKSGDPSVFGRAAEEIAAATAEGAPAEIVPGITAASAAAASLGQPLTTRGVAQRLILATATGRDGALAEGTGAGFGPGAALALYMGRHRLAGIRDSLLARGADPATAVSIVTACSLPDEHRITLPLARLAEAATPAGPAILLLRWGQVVEAAPLAPAVPRAERAVASGGDI